MALSIVFWLIVLAAVIHIAEEYRLGWIEWVRVMVSSVDLKSFIIVNALFLMLCFSAAVWEIPILRLFVIGIIGSNALIHIGGSVQAKRLMPGVLSAVFAYVPLTVLGLIFFFRIYHFHAFQAILWTCLGALIVGVPAGVQLIRTRLKKGEESNKKS